MAITVLLAGAGCASTQPEPGSSTSEAVGTTAGRAEPTTPASDVGQLTVLGDWGAGTANQVAIAQAMEQLAAATPTDAILTTGDNFYSDDEAVLMEPFDWALQTDIPFWIAWGNHDIESEERIEDINTIFDSPPRWTVHEWGVVDVVILDSNQVTNPEQLTFLRDRLAASSDPAIVVFHHPAWSCSLHGASQAILTTWVPLFDEDVFLVLSGHDHNYQRFVDGGVTYVVTGGGGRQIYDVGKCPLNHPRLQSSAAEYHFVVLQLNGNVVTLTSYRSDLSIIETVDLPIRAP